jgi:dCMP deaminase
MNKQLMLYCPVIHHGYEAIIDRHPDASEILILDESFLEDFAWLSKEIRAIPAFHAAQYLRSRYRGAHIRTIGRSELPQAITAMELVVPAEDIMFALVEAHNLDKEHHVVYDPTFLRWDRNWSKAARPPEFDGIVSSNELDLHLMLVAKSEAERSSDWWRRVGALAVRNGEILITAYNVHQPTEYSPYINGDPRNNAKRGIDIEISTAHHAEAGVISLAAKSGIALAGADLYVTTFPCPPCAYLIAGAGFSRLFFAGGYSILAGDQVLRKASVEQIFVE